MSFFAFGRTKYLLIGLHHKCFHDTSFHPTTWFEAPIVATFFSLTLHSIFTFPSCDFAFSYFSLFFYDFVCFFSSSHSILMTLILFYVSLLLCDFFPSFPSPSSWLCFFLSLPTLNVSFTMKIRDRFNFKNLVIWTKMRITRLHSLEENKDFEKPSLPKILVLI